MVNFEYFISNQTEETFLSVGINVKAGARTKT